MRNLIQSGLAILVIVTSLTFTTIGIARAATGYTWNPPHTGLSLLSLAPTSAATPSPTKTSAPAETAPRQEIGAAETLDDYMEGSSDQNEMENDDSSEQDDDSQWNSGTRQADHHHSDSHETPSSDDEGGDD